MERMQDIHSLFKLGYIENSVSILSTDSNLFNPKTNDRMTFKPTRNLYLKTICPTQSSTDFSDTSQLATSTERSHSLLMTSYSKPKGHQIFRSTAYSKDTTASAPFSPPLAICLILKHSRFDQRLRTTTLPLDTDICNIASNARNASLNLNGRCFAGSAMAR